MANTIKIKAGSGTPTTSNIADRELAFDRSANKLYINDAGTIVELTPDSSSADITSVVAGSGLTGGATSGAATLNIGAGTGIDVAADAISVDVSDFMSNGADNRVLTATGTDAFRGEGNLTFDGSTLAVTGALTTTSTINIAGVATFQSHLEMGDSDILKLGSDTDLKIQHTGNHGYITNDTGHLYIRSGADDKQINIQADDGSGGMTDYMRFSGNESLIRVYKNTRFGDTVNAQFGDNADLQIKHDGSNSIIKADGTGDLTIRQDTADKDILLRCDDGSGGIATYITLDGSAGTVNIDKEINLAAHLDMGDDDRIRLGASGDLQIVHTSNINFIHSTISDRDIYFRVNDGGTNKDAIIIDASENALITTHGNLTVGGQVNIQDTNAIVKRNSGQMELLTYGGYNIDLNPAGDVRIDGASLVFKNNAEYIYNTDASGTSTRMFGMNSGNTTYIGPIDSYAGGSIIYGVSSNVSSHNWYTDGSARMTLDGNVLDLPNTGDWSFIKNNTNSGGLRFGTKDGSGNYANQIEISNTGNYVKLNENTSVTGYSSATEHFQLNFAGTSNSLLKIVNSGWSNETTHDILFNYWQSNLGDYTYLKSAGNSTSGHGIALVGDSVFAVGDTTVATGAVTNSATAPFTDTWFTVNGSGNGVFKGSVTSVGASVSGNITVTGTVDGRDVASDGSKLDGIESGATADQTITLTGDVTGSGSGSFATTVVDNSHNHHSITSNTGDPGDSRLQYWQTNSNTTLNPNSNWFTAIRMGHGDPVTYYSNTIAVQMTGTGTGDLYTRNTANGNAGSWFKHWNDGNDGSGSGLDADTVDGQHASAFLTSSSSINATTLDNFDSTRFFRRDGAATATVGAGWMTVATNTSGRRAGEILVTDADSGDHGFIRIHWLRSYADSNFTVINCGGHQNRITGVRVLSQDSDNTYGEKVLQVYVTANSSYDVKIFKMGDDAHYTAHTVHTPTIENTISGYSVHGNSLENLDTYGFAHEEGIYAGGALKAGGVATFSNRVDFTGTDGFTIGNYGGYDRIVNNSNQFRFLTDGDAYANMQFATVTAGTWNGSVIASAYLDADTAHLSGTQTFSGAKTFGTQTWNGHITWNNGINIYAAGESSIDVSGSGVFQVWDSGTGSPFIKCDVGQTVEIGQAGARGLKVYGDIKLATATNKLYLDGGSNTFIHENAADTIGFATNGVTRFTMNGGGDLYVSNKVQAGGNGIEIWDSTHGFKQVLGKDSTYTFLKNNDGNVMIHLGDSGDGNTYFQAGEHRFRNLAGSAYYARIGSGYIRNESNGSAAAPAFSWTNDPDLGFYRNGANNMRFSAGNAIRGTWNGDGLVLNGGSLGVNVAIPTTDGVIRAGNDVIAFYSSDERLKENVKPIENALDKVSNIRGVEFDWIVDKKIHANKGHDVGVIAQEIEKVLPEVVETRDNGYKAVKYEKIVSLLIEAVKEQQVQINELKTKLGE